MSFQSRLFDAPHSLLLLAEAHEISMSAANALKADVDTERSKIVDQGDTDNDAE
ncbi:MAG: hypothetical protein Q7U12_05875 [Undibacterium sp.]|nr:hypothetical protein [Undibacterium sp.]MDO9192405.1 hypothetical protein [Undibacterium sp.]